MSFSDLHIETTKRLAAQRQIDAAVNHLRNSELECAIALAIGAEGLLPETESRQVFAYVREHPLSKQVDIEKTIIWLAAPRPKPQQFLSLKRQSLLPE